MAKSGRAGRLASPSAVIQHASVCVLRASNLKINRPQINRIQMLTARAWASLPGQQVRKDESLPLCDDPLLDRDRVSKHRARRDKRVELPFFATGVCGLRQL